MEELWRPITCLPDQELMHSTYEASTLGRIRNSKTKHQMSPHLINSGYYTFQYTIYPTQGPRKYKAILWHRVIAMTWIPNPLGLPQVDHIDEDRGNNCVANLQWVDAQTNINRSQEHTHKPKLCNRDKPVYWIDSKGKIVYRYENMEEAAIDKHMSIRNVMRICSGDRMPKAWGHFIQDAHLAHRGKTIIERDGELVIVDKIDN